MNKADKQESERRVRQVSNWLLDGESSSDIIEYCRSSWRISQAQTYKYIEKARELWQEINNNEIAYNLNWHIQTRRKLLNKCIKDGDKSNARQILNDLADIQGISRNRMEVTGKDGKPIQTENIDKLKKVIDKMNESQRKIFFDIVEQNNGLD